MLILFWAIIYLPNLKHQLIDPLETFYVEASREMNLFEKVFTPVINGRWNGNSKASNHKYEG